MIHNNTNPELDQADDSFSHLVLLVWLLISHTPFRAFFFFLLFTSHNPHDITQSNVNTHTHTFSLSHSLELIFFSTGSAVSARHPRSPFPRATYTHTHTSSRALDRILASTLLIHFFAFLSLSLPPRQLFYGGTRPRQPDFCQDPASQPASYSPATAQTQPNQPKSQPKTRLHICLGTSNYIWTFHSARPSSNIAT